MINLPLASIWVGLISVVWLISALMLIGIILIQKGKGGGLGGAFGGAGGGGGLLGTKTGDFLTWVTIGLVFLFFFLAIVLVKIGGNTVPEGLTNEDNGVQTTEVDTSGTGDGTSTTPDDATETAPPALPEATPPATPDAPATE